MRFQFWDVHGVGFQDPNLEIFWTWFSGRGILSFWRPGVCTPGFQDPKRPGKFRTWDLNFGAREIQDLGSQLWGQGNFRIWFSGHGFQDLGSQLWSLGNFRIWFSGHGFQDMVFRTWDLNFGAWIFTLAVSKTEIWKLLGRDFQDVRSQFWDLDFTQGASHDRGPEIFLAHDFQDMDGGTRRLHSVRRSRAPTSPMWSVQSIIWE